MSEPELITILEGPTPEFQPVNQDLFYSIADGALDAAITLCELRTANGPDIRLRCRQAWHEGRTVQLDFPDDMRLRHQVDVVALRLKELEEGTVLMLWTRWPVTVTEEMEDEGFDDADYDDADESPPF